MLSKTIVVLDYRKTDTDVISRCAGARPVSTSMCCLGTAQQADQFSVINGKCESRALVNARLGTPRWQVQPDAAAANLQPTDLHAREPVQSFCVCHEDLFTQLRAGCPIA